MAYEKQEWLDGLDEFTPMTAERMNHIEDGIADACDTETRRLQFTDNTAVFEVISWGSGFQLTVKEEDGTRHDLAFGADGIGYWINRDHKWAK